MISMKLQNKNKKCPRISSEALTSLIQPVELIKPIQPIELFIVLLGGQLSNRVITDLLEFVRVINNNKAKLQYFFE